MRLIILIITLLLARSAIAQGPKPVDCEASPERRQFDFWLGEWEVTDKAGDRVLGNNTISRREGGCYLFEAWRSAGGGSGSSMNYYDPQIGKWHQLWLDAGYSIISTTGGIVDGSMVMTGSIHYLDAGTTHPFRGTWTPMPDGRVRQFFEQGDDAGKWQVWFEGFYRKVE